MSRAVAMATGWAIVTAIAGGLLTTVDSWYYALRKPGWQPPNWAFAPAWTIIFALSAWAGVIAWNHAGSATGRAWIVALFVTNGLLNMGWSLLFFRLRRPDLALAEVGPLWLSILAMMLGLGRFSTRAALLMLPYLIWVSFAACLNRAIVRRNPRVRSF